MLDRPLTSCGRLWAVSRHVWILKNSFAFDRSAIVQVDRLKEMRPAFHGDYIVILQDGTRLNLSRSYREKLQALLGQTF